MRKIQSIRQVFLLAVQVVTVIGFAGAQQEDSLKNILNEFKHLQRSYLQNKSVSFDIKYTYSNESTPENILDSLNGHVDISGTHFHSLIDSTETIQNDRYNIVLFKKDKIMYVSKASSLLKSYDPLAQMDSMLSKVHGLRCVISMNNNEKTLTLLFPEGLEYKKIDFVIDTISGLLISSDYWVKTEQLMDRSVFSDNENTDRKIYDRYALVKTNYFNYTNTAPGILRFDEKQYFIKTGKEFKTIDSFRDYKIFIATPNL